MSLLADAATLKMRLKLPVYTKDLDRIIIVIFVKEILALVQVEFHYFSVKANVYRNSRFVLSVS